MSKRGGGEGQKNRQEKDHTKKKKGQVEAEAWGEKAQE